MASDHGTLAHLLPQTYKRLISQWLEEDCTSFDYGGFVVGESSAEAKLLGKSEVGSFTSTPLYITVYDLLLKTLSPIMVLSVFFRGS